MTSQQVACGKVCGRNSGLMGYLLKRYGTWPFMVDLPSKNGLIQSSTIKMAEWDTGWWLTYPFNNG